MAKAASSRQGGLIFSTLTAFYVDNGKNLPLWKELPEIAFWFCQRAIRGAADPYMRCGDTHWS